MHGVVIKGSGHGSKYNRHSSLTSSRGRRVGLCVGLASLLESKGCPETPPLSLPWLSLGMWPLGFVLQCSSFLAKSSKWLSQLNLPHSQPSFPPPHSLVTWELRCTGATAPWPLDLLPRERRRHRCCKTTLAWHRDRRGRTRNSRALNAEGACNS